MTLGRQFTVLRDDIPGMTSYTVGHSVDPGEHGYHDFRIHGRVSIIHEPEYKAQPFVRTNWTRDDMRQPSRPGSQQRLFDMVGGEHRPARSTVFSMEFTKTSRAMALPVLGRAELDARERNGVSSLTASGDRSDHSERLVERLADRGATEYTPRENANDIDFPRQPSVARQVHYGVPLSPEQMDEGRRHAREVVRSTRRPRPAQQQQSLF